MVQFWFCVRVALCFVRILRFHIFCLYFSTSICSVSFSSILNSFLTVIYLYMPMFTEYCHLLFIINKLLKKNDCLKDNVYKICGWIYSLCQWIARLCFHHIMMSCSILCRWIVILCCHHIIMSCTSSILCCWIHVVILCDDHIMMRCASSILCCWIHVVKLCYHHIMMSCASSI